MINISCMFYFCSKLIYLNISNFNTNNVNNMSYMFSYCSSLTSLNLSNFNTNNVKYMSGMFSDLKKDCIIICNDIKIKEIKF